MQSFHFLGWAFNGLEFITFVLIPASIILILLVYFLFNYRLLVLTFSIDDDVLSKMTKK